MGYREVCTFNELSRHHTYMLHIKLLEYDVTDVKKSVWVNKLLILSGNLSMHSSSGCTFSIHMPFLFQNFISLYLKAGRPSLFIHLKKSFPFLMRVSLRKNFVSASTATACSSNIYNKLR